MGEPDTVNESQPAVVSGVKRRTLADYIKEYICIEDFLPNSECCPLGSDIDYEKLNDSRVWAKIDFLDLHTLSPGTFVHACGGHAAARYTIRINKGNVDIWRDLLANGHGGAVNSIVSLGGPNFFLRGIIKKRASFIMPYFSYDYSRPPEDRLIEIPEENYWCDTYEAIFVKR